MLQPGKSRRTGCGDVNLFKEIKLFVLTFGKCALTEYVISAVPGGEIFPVLLSLQVYSISGMR